MSDTHKKNEWLTNFRELLFPPAKYKLVKRKKKLIVARPKVNAEMLEEAINRRLKGNKKVTSPLITRWWASGDNNRKPNDEVITEALINAARELGLMTNAQDMEKWRTTIFNSLEFNPDDAAHISAEWVMHLWFAKAWDAFSAEWGDKLGIVKGIGDRNLGVASSCLISQTVFQSDLDALHSKGGTLLIALHWPLGHTRLHRNTRTTVDNLLLEKTTTSFLSDTLSEDEVSVRIHFFDEAETHKSGDLRGEFVASLNTEEERELIELGDVVRKQIKDRLRDKSNYERLHLSFKLCPILPTTVQNMWTILVNDDEDAKAWSLVRHSGLRDKFSSEKASTFCSPIKSEEAKAILEPLSVKYVKHWIFEDGEYDLLLPPN